VLSFDTNILLHAFNQDSPAHERAFAWMSSLQDSDAVAVSEFILAEFYRLLRNPAVLECPLSPADAVDVIQVYRNHPRWALLGFPRSSRDLHDSLWQRARETEFPYRRLFDTRTALTMIGQGVTELATANIRDFEGLGFDHVWNPLSY
jgi:toxin-antitoxin system PIN domain toxin